MLIAATLLGAWFGSMSATNAFTSNHQDSNYLLIGLLILVISAATGVIAWLVLERSISEYQKDRVALAYLALVFALPIVSGVATNVIGARRWRAFQHPTDGYTFSTTPDSAVVCPGSHLDQPPRNMVIYPGYGAAVRAGVPANAIKVVVGPFDGPPPAGESYRVGEEGYFGTIVGPSRDDSTGTYSLAIVYEAAGERWQITGTFAELPDRSNPNAETFHDIVGSLSHEQSSVDDPNDISVNVCGIRPPRAAPV